MRVIEHSIPSGCDAEPFTRSVVELRRYAIAVLLGEPSHALALREILPDEPEGSH